MCKSSIALWELATHCALFELQGHTPNQSLSLTETCGESLLSLLHVWHASLMRSAVRS